MTPTIQRQSVADHSFGVAIAAMWVMKKWGTDPALREAVLREALEHDMDEAVSSDIPSPYKHRGAPVRERPERYSVLDIIKCADMLELMAFLQDEAYLGNRALGDVTERNRKIFCERWGAALLTEWLNETKMSVHPVLEECS